MTASPDHHVLLDTLEEIAGLRSQFEVFRFMRSAGRTFGYTSFMVANLPPPTSFGLGENTVITNFPASFLGEFDRLQLLGDSRLVARLRSSVLPFVFSREDVLAWCMDMDNLEMRRAFDGLPFDAGSVVPVHDHAGRRAFVTFLGSGLQAEWKERLGFLVLLAIHVFQRLTDLGKVGEVGADTLTEREIDCLTWTAAGKTSADIAAILSLSEHTVNHYLNRAARKLDTVNRTQAVAKALRHGLIS